MWLQQEFSMNLDSKNMMWGLPPQESLDTLRFNGGSLRDKFSMSELWLRSDIARLTKIFDIATLERIELDKTEFQL